MRELCLLLSFFSLVAGACAGGSSRYGCPARSGHSCKSVSEVYAETTSGGKSAADPLHGSPANEKIAKKKLPKGGAFRTGKDARRRPAGREITSAPTGDTEAMPVYLPPRAIRLWIAPWQDARGVFHSGKYVYVLSGRGRWTIGGKTVPLGESPEEYPVEIRLRAAGRAP